MEDSNNLFCSSIIPWSCERISSKCTENLGIRRPKVLPAVFWDYTSTQIQSRELISDDSPDGETKLLFSNRTQSCAVTSLLTGHNTLRRHLYIMGLIGRPLFRRCGAQGETSVYVLCEVGTLETLKHNSSFFFFSWTFSTSEI